MKIAIAGLGYVGLSNAVLLAQQSEVVAIDIAAHKVAMLNRKQSPIEDAELEDHLQNRQSNPRAHTRQARLICYNYCLCKPVMCTITTPM